MKIGILTIHRIYNHGSFLQSFAVKSIIQGILPNAEVEFLDWPSEDKSSKPVYNIPKKRIAKPSGLKFFCHKLLGHNVYCRDVELAWLHACFGQNYRKLCADYLAVSPESNYSTDYDLIVVGSDESFNCTQDDAPWDTTLCFNLIGKNVISYAASFGYSTLKRLDDYGLSDIVKSGLSSYKSISVRDRNSQEIVKALTGREAAVHLDPVLVFDYSRFIPDIKIKSDFILVYNYLNRINDPDFITRIKAFAKKNRLKIISIFEFCPWADKNIVLSSFEVLAYFKKAKYVVTDTFHGAVMSIKFNKQFIAFVRESNRNKLHYLIDYFGLTDRILTDINNFESIIQAPVDWIPVNDKIAHERNRTLSYFSVNLNNL